VFVEFDQHRIGVSAEQLRAARQRVSPGVPVVAGRGWQPAHREMAEAVKDPPATIAGVLDRLATVQQILDGLPPSPGTHRVAAFNALYRTITARVAALLSTRHVADPEFLELLDVEFARLYFGALAAWGADDPHTPDAWEVLFRRGQDSDVTPLVAASLGVNAHINHDLALALIGTWKRLGFPGDGKPHPDYLLINKIFFSEIPVLRRRFATAWQLDIDRFVGGLDDWSQRVLVQTTRAMAWERAEYLWQLRDDEQSLKRAMLIMDRAAAIVGETLLSSTNVLRVLWLTLTWLVARRRRSAPH
jgi:hypothetical protein